MGRQSKFGFTLSDGQTVGYSFKERQGIYSVRFAHPTIENKYLVISTGCATLADAHLEAAKIVLKAYKPTIPADLKKVKWDDAVKELEQSPLRPDTLRNYKSLIRVLRATIETTTPSDITTETATRFKRLYLQGTSVRTDKSDAKRYPRSPISCRTYLRSLRSLWAVHFRELGFVSNNPWLDVSYPDVPKKDVVIPKEDAFAEFSQWLEKKYPDWPLPKLWVAVKAIAGCRTLDLCHARSQDLSDGKLTLHHTKTKKARTFPLPPDLFAELQKIAGPTWLWENYTTEAKIHRAGKNMKDTFSPKTLYWAMSNIFREFNEKAQNKVKPHDFRKRAITLTTLATGNVDATAQAIGIDPQTARRYYLDASKALDGEALMKKMAEVLRPKSAD